jgi:hypothetical protein
MVTIYELVCTATRKSYVGSTRNPAKRMREHRCLLRQGKHAEPELQADWAKYGPAEFTLRSLGTLPDSSAVADIRRAELDAMDMFDKIGQLYNTKRFAYQPPPGVRPPIRRGFQNSAESNLKRRLAQLGVPKGHGAAISAGKKRKRDEIVCAPQECGEARDKEPAR